MSQQNDHDVLIQIDANLRNFIQKFEEHTVEDKEHFHRIYSKTAYLEKALWMALGVIGAVEVAFRVWR